ncbi:hypothetical protein WG219_11400 [Ectopseudomonas mendocina]|uniref:Uncharacterized protein n=1 Tax=Ectopseudomonas mendocina TaxID=300 RepID=A0ABZ2RGZ9_ECTME
MLSNARLTSAVDAAMVEMQNISPPLRRSECARLIHAALSRLNQQPASGGDDLTASDLIAAAAHRANRG